MSAHPGMRIAVTGRTGQLARALRERAAAAGADVVCVSRPEMELAEPGVLAGLFRTVGPDAIVNAAAYTAVDKAESEPDVARAINAAGARTVAEAARDLGVPLVQMSTDYVFAGTRDRRYREDDRTGPRSVYGATKLEGEEAVAAATPDHMIVRTSWVYSPFGVNFVRTMLRLGAERDEVAVVDDQVGAPTSALDLADGILAACANLVARPDEAALRGIFHMTAAGEASWADVAEATFAAAAARGGPTARVRRIATADNPRPAERPANSRLDTAKVAAVHGIRLPDWHAPLDACVARILAEGDIR
ncbi:dTDP-4-dehydrorhamnose reductase [Amorphus sp. MBR-141]